MVLMGAHVRPRPCGPGPSLRRLPCAAARPRSGGSPDAPTPAPAPVAPAGPADAGGLDPGEGGAPRKGGPWWRWRDERFHGDGPRRMVVSVPSGPPTVSTTPQGRHSTPV